MNTNILQSILAFTKAEISEQHILQISYKDLRTYFSQKDDKIAAETYNKLVVKSTAKIAKLARNAKAIKLELGVNAYHDYMNKMADDYDGDVYE